MEIIKSVFFWYIELVISWWWIVFAVATVISHTAFLFWEEENCEKMSLMKTLQLPVVGLINFIPLVRRMISRKSREHFRVCWLSLRMGGPFWMFLITLFPVTLVFGPITFLASLGLWIFTHVYRSAFGYDAGKYGFINAVKLKFGVKPESLNRR